MAFNSLNHLDEEKVKVLGEGDTSSKVACGYGVVRVEGVDRVNRQAKTLISSYASAAQHVQSTSELLSDFIDY